MSQQSAFSARTNNTATLSASKGGTASTSSAASANPFGQLQQALQVSNNSNHLSLQQQQHLFSQLLNQQQNNFPLNKMHNTPLQATQPATAGLFSNLSQAQLDALQCAMSGRSIAQTSTVQPPSQISLAQPIVSKANSGFDYSQLLRAQNGTATSQPSPAALMLTGQYLAAAQMLGFGSNGQPAQGNSQVLKPIAHTPGLQSSEIHQQMVTQNGLPLRADLNQLQQQGQQLFHPTPITPQKTSEQELRETLLRRELQAR